MGSLPLNFAIFVIFKGGRTGFFAKSSGIYLILLQFDIFNFKIYATLNLRSSMKIVRGAQLALAEKRATLASTAVLKGIFNRTKK